MKTDKNEILTILHQEGISRHDADVIFQEIQEGDDVLDRFAPAQVGYSVLERVENTLIERLTQGRFKDNRYVLLKRIGSAAAVILLVFGVTLLMHRYSATGPAENEKMAQSEEVAILLESTDWAEFVLADQNDLEVDEEALTELMLFYEDSNGEINSLQGKEYNHEDQKSIVYRDSWRGFV